MSERPSPQKRRPPQPGPHLPPFCLSPALAAQAYALKEENDSLRWQLDAYRNEVELLKQEKGQLCRAEGALSKDRQLQLLQQTVQGMQQVPRPGPGAGGPERAPRTGRPRQCGRLPGDRPPWAR